MSGDWSSDVCSSDLKDTIPAANRRIQKIPANHKKNPWGFDTLVYAPVGGLKPIPVVLHGGQWYELQYDRQALSPYLGNPLPEVHTFDEFAEDLQAEEPHSSDGEPEEDPTVSIQIRNSPVDTQDTSKNSPHHIVSFLLNKRAELEIGRAHV